MTVFACQGPDKKGVVYITLRDHLESFKKAHCNLLYVEEVL